MGQLFPVLAALRDRPNAKEPRSLLNTASICAAFIVATTSSKSLMREEETKPRGYEIFLHRAGACVCVMG